MVAILEKYRKQLTVLWLLVAIGFIFIKGILPGWQEVRSDFSNYYASAKLIAEGENISDFYDNVWFSESAIVIGEKQGAKFAPFPPATAFLYLPLTAFSPLKAKQAWLVINLFLIFVIVLKSIDLLGKNAMNSALVFSLFLIPIASNIRLGQAYLLFTLFILFYLESSLKNQRFFGGSLLGFATALKYFPGVFLVAILPKTNKRILFGFVVGFGLISALPLLFFGWAPYQVFFGELFSHLNGNISGQGQFSYTFQSIDSLLANLFIYDAVFNPNSPFNLPELKPILKIIFWLTILFFTVKAIKKGIYKAKEITIGLVVFAATLLIPASATYHLLLVFPAIVLLINKLESNKEMLALLALTFITCNLLPHHIPHLSNHFVDTLVHFPRFYGLFGLFIYLLILQNRHLRLNE